MAGPRTCYSPRRHPPLVGEDELAGGPTGAPTEDSNTPTPSLAFLLGSDSRPRFSFRSAL